MLVLKLWCLLLWHRNRLGASRTQRQFTEWTWSNNQWFLRCDMFDSDMITKLTAALLGNWSLSVQVPQTTTSNIHTALKAPWVGIRLWGWNNARKAISYLGGYWSVAASVYHYYSIRLWLLHSSSGVCDKIRPSVVVYESDSWVGQAGTVSRYGRIHNFHVTSIIH